MITKTTYSIFILELSQPSLLFFKKFTETEAKQWETIAKKAEKDITTKYKDQTEPIEKKLTLRGKEAPTAD